MRSMSGGLVLLSALLMAGPVHSARTPKLPLPDPKPGQAQIVVLRSTSVNALVGVRLFEVIDGDPKLLGEVSNNRKVAIDLAPGDHVLMIGNRQQYEFLRATVEPDKRYYVVIAPIWPGQWFLRPVRHAHANSPALFKVPSSQIAKMLKKTKYVPLVPEAQDEKERLDVRDFYKIRWAKWQAKPESDKESFTLHAADSVN